MGRRPRPRPVPLFLGGEPPCPAAETTYPRLRRVLGKDRFRSWVVDRLELKVVNEQLEARGVVTSAVPQELPREAVDRAIAGLIETTAATVGAH